MTSGKQEYLEYAKSPNPIQIINFFPNLSANVPPNGEITILS